MATLDPYRYIPTNAPLTKAQIEAMAAEQKKKDEAAAAKEKAAYEEQKKANNTTYNTAKSTVANTKPASYNTSQYYAAQAIQNAGQTVPVPKTPIEEYLEDVQRYTTAAGIVNSTPSTSHNTAELEAAKAVNAARENRIDKLNEATSSNSSTNKTPTTTGNGYVPVADLNRPTNGSGVMPTTTGNGYVPVSDLNRPTNGSGVPVNRGNGGGGNGGDTPIAPDITPIIAGGVIPILPKDEGQLGDASYIGDNGGGGGYPSGGGGSSGGGSSTPSAPSGGYYNGANWSGGTSYKPYPTAEDMANYVSTIIKAAKEELGGVKEPVYLTKHMGSDELITKPDAPALRTLEELAKTFGITYDYDSIYKILNDSVEKQYDAIYQRQKQNEDAYYDNAVAAQNTLLDTLSRDRSSAVQAGVSKGMQAANALGAMLGVSQQFANNATALSQERSNTAKDYGASLAKAVVDAEATSNERKNAIMEISKMLYGYDSEQYVANMDNYNTILTNNAALQQTYMNNHTALQNALASIFGGVAANKITGDANVQSSTLAAEAQKAAAQLAANAQIQAAQEAAAANRYAAEQSYLNNQAIANANKDAATTTANANKWIALLQAGLLNGNEVPQNPNGYVPVADLNSSTNGTTVGSSPLDHAYAFLKDNFGITYSDLGNFIQSYVDDYNSLGSKK